MSPNALLTDAIRISSGYISGSMIGDPSTPVRIYRGIPYAAAPTGPLRWRPPHDALPWQGTRDCTAMPKCAPQAIGKVQMYHEIAQSEDCLHLNVLTPARRSDEGLPVMVWLHGGAFIHG